LPPLALLAPHFIVPLPRLLAFLLTLRGLLPIAAGVALNLLSDFAFKTPGTTVKPFEWPSFMVTPGVFALSRNPMYLGMVLLLVGVALLVGTLLPLVIATAFAVLLDARFIQAWERVLADAFGVDWRAYRNRVRRWLYL